MRTILGTLAALLVAGCASPAGPTLPTTLTFKMEDYEESGGLLPITGTLELIIETDGDATSACRRQVFKDVERSDSLTREQLVELVARVEAWTAKRNTLPAVAGKPHGQLIYGDHKASWAKGAELPPEVNNLVTFLLTIPPTLNVVHRMKGR